MRTRSAISQSLLLLCCLCPALEAGQWRLRPREQLEGGRIDSGDGRGRVRYAGLVSALDIAYEEPFEYRLGLTVHRGALSRKIGSHDRFRATTVGLEALRFPAKSMKLWFVRGGLLAESLNPGGPVRDFWVYGLSLGAGLEIPVWKLGIAPEFGFKSLWGSRGRKHGESYAGVGVHLYGIPEFLFRGRRTGSSVGPDGAPLGEMDQPESSGACAVKSDSILAGGAVGPAWIPWDSPCLPDARVAYVDKKSWDIWVMDASGGNKRCLTCFGDNALGLNFPPDEDGRRPAIHWKGDPEVHPTRPIILFKAENEHSPHRPIRNAPSIGWDNDIWALDVCARRYTRLTKQARRQGIQHSAISEDGRWYVYPRRYSGGRFLKGFGRAEMVFGELAADASGQLRLAESFADAPNGKMYYEPNDIQRGGDGAYSLFYVAGPGTMLDPYRYDWCPGGTCPSVSRRLQDTPQVHEEFTMVAPSGRRIAWMRGPRARLSYHSDLFISDPDFRRVERVTWFNDCRKWPDRCRPDGVQLSRLDWSGDGTAVYFGVWEHGRWLPFGETALHKIEFAGACGSE